MKNVLLVVLALVFNSFIGLSQQHEEGQNSSHAVQVEQKHSQESKAQDNHSNNHSQAATTEEHSEEHSTEAHGSEEKFNAGEMIMHHIGDAHDFHIVGDLHMPLPIIAYNKTKGKLDMFMSSKLRGHGHDQKVHNGYAFDHGKLVNVDGDDYIDFSITKNVFAIILTCILMMVIFISIANAYKKNGIAAPKGIQSFFEPIIVFIRDEVAKPYLGNKANRFLPYLLTVFFFIWILNMLGLVPFFPGSANVTGNIGVTLVLAVITFLVTQLSGNKHYWGHIFKPDVPVWMYIIVVPVEILGIFTKPFALMVRLFANITAGHIIILSFVSLIFIFGNAGQNIGGGLIGSVVTVAFGLFMNFIELLVAAVQAFIFTTLSAVFIGAAVEKHH